MSKQTRFIANVFGTTILAAASLTPLAASAASAGDASYNAPYYLEFARTAGTSLAPPPLSQQAAVANPEVPYYLAFAGSAGRSPSAVALPPYSGNGPATNPEVPYYLDFAHISAGKSGV